MGQLIADLGNSNNWNLVWNVTVEAQLASPTRYYPIPQIHVPLLLEKHILAIFSTSSTAKPTWKFAGFINQKIRTGITVGGSADADINQNHKIWLNRINLLILPKLSETYSVDISVPNWFEDISFSLWEYVGSISDSTENLITQIKIDLARIESKIHS